MKFKEILKNLRTSRGITQAELAHKLDIPESSIRRYESSEEGLPNKKRLELIADFFGVSVDLLLGRIQGVVPPMPDDWYEKNRELYTIYNFIKEVTGNEDLTLDQVYEMKDDFKKAYKLIQAFKEPSKE